MNFASKGWVLAIEKKIPKDTLCPAEFCSAWWCSVWYLFILKRAASRSREATAKEIVAGVCVDLC
jgi:hypothetical protein